jgi:hypothetical protein
VSGPANFVANGISVHNSLEQDADMWWFVRVRRAQLLREDAQATPLPSSSRRSLGERPAPGADLAVALAVARVLPTDRS